MDKRKSEIIRKLKEFKEENQIQKMIFFGSRTGSNYNKYSDIDLIIISSKFKKLKSFQRSTTIRLKWNLKYPVDMLCYTPEEFEIKKRTPSIVKEAVETGIEI